MQTTRLLGTPAETSPRKCSVIRERVPLNVPYVTLKIQAPLKRASSLARSLFPGNTEEAKEASTPPSSSSSSWGSSALVAPPILAILGAVYGLPAAAAEIEYSIDYDPSKGEFVTSIGAVGYFILVMFFFFR